VVVTNGKIIDGPQIGDHAWALLLGLTRQMFRFIPHLAQKKWTTPNYGGIELEGKTAVVIGVGGLGTAIAQRANAFGMRVIGVDPKDLPMNRVLARTVYPDRLDTVLPEADVVFVSAPHTPRTENMIGARQFGLMKKGAYFIAVSRGALYDSAALVAAIEQGRLAGAGLDVTNPEPLPPDHPLWKFDNVVITPHVAWVTDNDARGNDLVKENILRFVNGEQLRNVVDKRAGY
jgi:phosphoglycerate dehydrogenase-like enzyme